MTNDMIATEILTCISNITDIVPEVYLRKDSSSIMVCFEKNIPDEESVSKVENALKKFGKIIPNHSREAKFISFIIHR